MGAHLYIVRLKFLVIKYLREYSKTSMVQRLLQNLMLIEA